MFSIKLIKNTRILERSLQSRNSVKICNNTTLNGSLKTSDIFNQNIRTSSSLSDILRKKISDKQRSRSKHFPKGDHDGFTLIYKLPSIKTVAALSRLKLYQTAIVALVAPIFVQGFLSGALSESDIPIGGLSTIGGLTFITLGSLFYFSYITRRLIFYIWLNEETKMVKFAYLNFYANRKDFVLNLNQIDQFDKTKKELLQPLLKLKFQNEKQFYFTTIKYGQVMNKNLFQYVFGRLALQAFIENEAYKKR